MLKPQDRAMEWGKQMPVPSDVKTLEFFKFPWYVVDERTAVTSLWLDSDVHCFICNWFCVGSQPNVAELESVSSKSGMTFPEQLEASNRKVLSVPEWIDTCANLSTIVFSPPARWGSLAFNKGSTPSLASPCSLVVCQLLVTALSRADAGHT